MEHSGIESSKNNYQNQLIGILGSNFKKTEQLGGCLIKKETAKFW